MGTCGSGRNIFDSLLTLVKVEKDDTSIDSDHSVSNSLGSDNVQWIKPEEDRLLTLRPSIVCSESIATVDSFTSCSSKSLHTNQPFPNSLLQTNCFNSKSISISSVSSAQNCFTNTSTSIETGLVCSGNFQKGPVDMSNLQTFDHKTSDVLSPNLSSSILTSTKNHVDVHCLLLSQSLSYSNFLTNLREFEHDPIRSKYIYEKCVKLRYPPHLAVAMARLIKPDQLELSTNGQEKSFNRRLPDQGYLEIDGSHFSSNLQIVHPSDFVRSTIERSNKCPLTKAQLRQLNTNSASYSDKSNECLTRNSIQLKPNCDSTLMTVKYGGFKRTALNLSERNKAFKMQQRILPKRRQRDCRSKRRQANFHMSNSQSVGNTQDNVDGVCPPEIIHTMQGDCLNTSHNALTDSHFHVDNADDNLNLRLLCFHDFYQGLRLKLPRLPNFIYVNIGNSKCNFKLNIFLGDVIRIICLLMMHPPSFSLSLHVAKHCLSQLHRVALCDIRMITSRGWLHLQLSDYPQLMLTKKTKLFTVRNTPHSLVKSAINMVRRLFTPRLTWKFCCPMPLLHHVTRIILKPNAEELLIELCRSMQANPRSFNTIPIDQSEVIDLSGDDPDPGVSPSVVSSSSSSSHKIQTDQMIARQPRDRTSELVGASSGLQKLPPTSNHSYSLSDSKSNLDDYLPQLFSNFMSTNLAIDNSCIQSLSRLLRSHYFVLNKLIIQRRSIATAKASLCPILNRVPNLFDALKKVHTQIGLCLKHLHDSLNSSGISSSRRRDDIVRTFQDHFSRLNYLYHFFGKLTNLIFTILSHDSLLGPLNHDLWLHNNDNDCGGDKVSGPIEQAIQCVDEAWNAFSKSPPIGRFADFLHLVGKIYKHLLELTNYMRTFQTQLSHVNFCVQNTCLVIKKSWLPIFATQIDSKTDKYLDYFIGTIQGQYDLLEAWLRHDVFDNFLRVGQCLMQHAPWWLYPGCTTSTEGDLFASYKLSIPYGSKNIASRQKVSLHDLKLLKPWTPYLDGNCSKLTNMSTGDTSSLIPNKIVSVQGQSLSKDSGSKRPCALSTYINQTMNSTNCTNDSNRNSIIKSSQLSQLAKDTSYTKVATTEKNNSLLIRDCARPNVVIQRSTNATNNDNASLNQITIDLTQTDELQKEVETCQIPPVKRVYITLRRVDGTTFTPTAFTSKCITVQCRSGSGDNSVSSSLPSLHQTTATIERRSINVTDKGGDQIRRISQPTTDLQAEVEKSSVDEQLKSNPSNEDPTDESTNQLSDKASSVDLIAPLLPPTNTVSPLIVD